MSTMLPVLLSQLADMDLSTILGALSATLLVVVLVEREMLRVYGEPYARRAGALDIAIYPLLFVFAVIVIEHFYRLIFL